MHWLLLETSMRPFGEFFEFEGFAAHLSRHNLTCGRLLVISVGEFLFDKDWSSESSITYSSLEAIFRHLTMYV